MKWLILAILVLVYVLEAAVAMLNQRQSRLPLPEQVRDIYDGERYRKWLAYSLEGRRFGLVQRGFSLVVMMVLLLGPLAALAQWISVQVSNPVGQTLLFLGIYQLLGTAVDLPFSVYRTFSLEERHGFNRTTKATFIRDQLLSLALTLVLGGFLLAGLNALYLRFSARLWVFIISTWAVLSAVMTLAAVFLGRLFFRLFNKFTPLPEGELRRRIEELASQVGLNIRAISVMDASRRTTKSNAAFLGLGRTREVILYDTLLERMSPDEVVAVLAHELGHAVHKDTWRMLLRQVGVMALVALVIGAVLQSPALFTAFGFSGVHFGFAFVLCTILLEPLFLVLGIPLNFLSRQAEYRADRFAAEKTSPNWLSSALKVLARENLANLNPHPLAVLLYHTHPPLKERLQALHTR